MTTKIDPGMVSDVLEIEKQLKELECDCRLNITIHNDFICIEGCDHISDTGFYLNGKEIEGMMLDDNGDYFIDIHRFKDMAIEWCAGKGWGFQKEIGLDGRVLVFKPYGNMTTDIEIFKWGRLGDKYRDLLSAELAALDFVYKQIQKEKKDEND